MCGRFYISENAKQKFPGFIDEESDYSPGQNIPVILMHENKLMGTKLKWGYSLSASRELVINARLETIEEKNIFKDDFQKHRCLILTSGFYEWDVHKRRISFENDEDILWLAGIYRPQEKEVVVITTNANHVMKPIHSRMPLMIHQKDMKAWLLGDFQQLFTIINEDLKIVSSHIQLSLFEE